MKRKLTLMLALAGISFVQMNKLYAQAGVGIASPDASAMLQVESTTKGVLVTRMTAAQRQAISSPATGLIVYQTDGTAGFYYNAGTSGTPNWVILLAGGMITNDHVAAGAGIVYSKLSLTNSIQNSDITANAITTSKVANGTVTTSKMADSAISGLKLLSNSVASVHLQNSAVTLSKINPTGASSGQVLTYDGSAVTWATPSGGGGTSLPTQSGNTGKFLSTDGTNLTWSTPENPKFNIAVIASSGTAFDFSSNTNSNVFVCDRRTATSVSSINIKLPDASNFPSGTMVQLVTIYSTGVTGTHSYQLLVPGVTNLVAHNTAASGSTVDISTNYVALATGVYRRFITDGSTWYVIGL